MKKVIVLGALLGFSSISNAALSPFYDSVERIKVVIESAEGGGGLVGPISSIRNVDELTYDVTTEKCVSTVKLMKVYPMPPEIGKATYEVEEANTACHF